MKRMLITAEQLKAINEAAFGGEIENGDINQTIRNYTNNNPGNLNEPVTFADPNVTNNKENAAYNPNNPNDSKGASQITVAPGVLKSVYESRYSKRQVELGRMLEMRRTGKVYSKKQLNEMFFETADNMARLKEIIGTCNLFDVFSAANILSDDGEERLKQAYMSGADLSMTLDELFSAADPEDQEEFLEELGG